MMASAVGRSHHHVQLVSLSAVAIRVASAELRADGAEFSVEVMPRVLTTAMVTTEMPAAMNPYSMAVAAVSSLKSKM